MNNLNSCLHNEWPNSLFTPAHQELLVLMGWEKKKRHPKVVGKTTPDTKLFLRRSGDPETLLLPLLLREAEGLTMTSPKQAQRRDQQPPADGRSAVSAHETGLCSVTF